MIRQRIFLGLLVFAVSFVIFQLWSDEPEADSEWLERPVLDWPVAADEEAAFVRSNVVFTLYHELAHVLVSELQLPILGREEAAADNFAWSEMLRYRPSEQRDRAIWSVLEAWRLEERYTRELGDDPLEPWSEYLTDEQRHYLGACLMIGADPDHFETMAMAVGLPEYRWEDCGFDLDQTVISWSEVIDLKQASGGDRGIEILIEPADPDMRAIESFVRQDEALDDLIQRLNQHLKLPRKIGLVFENCGEPGAWWDLEDGEIVICYEELLKFRQMYTISRPYPG